MQIVEYEGSGIHTGNLKQGNGGEFMKSCNKSFDQSKATCCVVLENSPSCINFVNVRFWECRIHNGHGTIHKRCV